MSFSNRFIMSVPKPDDLPAPSFPEVAFLGRSNVGKSSLLNALVGQKNLARVSNTPGRTQFLNFFLIDEKFYFVDMPGYGYAKAPKDIVQQWEELIYFYLLERPTLRRLYLLIDARHGLKKNDIEIMGMLDKSAISYQIVLTKIDKVRKQLELQKTKDTILEYIKKHPACYPFICSTSSEKKEGIKELTKYILDVMK